MSHDEIFSPSILILLGIGLVIVLVGAGIESPDEPAANPQTTQAQLVSPAPPSPSPTILGDKERGNLMDEWKTTRELLAKFDDRIHDLGHWGTGFVTGLLAVESFLLSQPSGSTIPLPVPVKMVVVVATLVLIFSLRILQSRHETFQLAAAIRARSIERILGLELTGVISQAHTIGRLWWLTN